MNNVLATTVMQGVESVEGQGRLRAIGVGMEMAF
jgi:hypothetical protein